MKSALLLIALATPALAAPAVYPGCAIPPDTFAHTWTLDAANGDNSTGDGSAAKPWRSLDSLTNGSWGRRPKLSTAPYAQNNWQPDPDAPIKPGDRIELRDGDYGFWFVETNNQFIDNGEDTFITVAPAPGAHPRLEGILVGSTRGWRFTGLTLAAERGAGTQGQFSFHVRNSTVSGRPTFNIVADHNLMQSFDDATAATVDQAGWRAKARQGIIARSSECIAFDDNMIRNVMDGVLLQSRRTLFEGNEINGFVYDGLNIQGTGPWTIRHNLITNSNHPGNSHHIDGIQGFANSNGSALDISFNRVIRVSDPKRVRWPTVMQGIAAFDGDWNNVDIEGNEVVTSACQGINWGSMHTGRIINNTLIDDGTGYGTGGATNANCAANFNIGSRASGGRAANDIMARNNLATSYHINYQIMTGATIDHNMLTKMQSFHSRVTIISATGQRTDNRDPGTYGGVIIPERADVRDVIAAWDPATLRYDVALRDGSAAIGAGNPEGALPVDLDGHPFSPTAPSIGARAHPSEAAIVEPPVIEPPVEPPVIEPPIVEPPIVGPPEGTTCEQVLLCRPAK